MKKRFMLLTLLAALLLGALMAFMSNTSSQAHSIPPPMTWVREFPKPLGNLPEGRIPSCRNTERYECGLLCGYSYDGKKAVSAVVCVPYWFKSTFEMPPPPPTPPPMP